MPFTIDVLETKFVIYHLEYSCYIKTMTFISYENRNVILYKMCGAKTQLSVSKRTDKISLISIMHI